MAENARDSCQYCGHPILLPVLSEYCTNCGRLSGTKVPGSQNRDPNSSPAKEDILFKLWNFRGPTYSFFKDRFEVTKGPELIESIPYSQLKDVQPRSQTYEEANGGIKIHVRLKGSTFSELELHNQANRKMDYDLVTWLTLKLAENEARKN